MKNALCCTLFFFFHEQLGGEKTTEKWLLWVRPKVSSTLLIWQIRCHFSPFIFLSLLQGSHEQCPVPKHQSNFAVKICGSKGLRCRTESLSRRWARPWELSLARQAERACRCRRRCPHRPGQNHAAGGGLRGGSSPVLTRSRAPVTPGWCGRRGCDPSRKILSKKTKFNFCRMKLSKISGTSLFFFRLLDALTHTIFDGREWNICNWQRKTYRPIKKREFSCLPLFQS